MKAEVPLVTIDDFRDVQRLVIEAHGADEMLFNANGWIWIVPIYLATDVIHLYAALIPIRHGTDKVMLYNHEVTFSAKAHSIDLVRRENDKKKTNETSTL